jgi:hypothetical protein
MRATALMALGGIIAVAAIFLIETVRDRHPGPPVAAHSAASRAPAPAEVAAPEPKQAATAGGTSALESRSETTSEPTGIDATTTGPELAEDAAAVAPVAVPDGNLIGRQAKEWGVSDCLGPVVTVAEHLTRNTEYAFRLMAGQGNPDREMFSGTIAARAPSLGVSGLSSLYAAPIGGGRCNIAYQTTVYYNGPCVEAWEKNFSAFSEEVDIGKAAAAFTTKQGNATLYLLPAGPAGCIAVKTESFY